MSPASRTIGLLGGMSPESSIEYERIINSEVRRVLGGVHSASLLVRSYDFGIIERLQEEEAWDESGALAGAVGCVMPPERHDGLRN